MKKSKLMRGGVRINPYVRGVIAGALSYGLALGASAAVSDATDDWTPFIITTLVGLIVSPIIGSTVTAYTLPDGSNINRDAIIRARNIYDEAVDIYSRNGFEGLRNFINEQRNVSLTDTTANNIITAIDDEKIRLEREMEELERQVDNREIEEGPYLLAMNRLQKDYKDLARKIIPGGAEEPVEEPVEAPIQTNAITNPLRVARVPVTRTTVPVEPSDTVVEIDNPMRSGRGKKTPTTSTNRIKFLKKHGLPSDTSLSLKQLAELSGFPIQALRQVRDRGVGAWKTSIGSVRMKDGSKNPSAPRTSKMSKEQWSSGRVYAFLMKTKKVFYGSDNDIREAYGLE